MIELMENALRSKLFWIVASFALIYLYFKIVIYSYWKRHGIPQDDFTVPLGIFNSDFFMQKTTMGNVVKNSYEKFKKYLFHGIYMFHTRFMMINDPELIKQILVKDFANFCDRGLYSNTEIDPMIGHLFFLTGDKWRTIRSKLSPTFTSGKLKHMFPILNDIAHEMISIVNENLLKTNVVEMKDLIARYTTDTIFSLAFGFDSKSLKKPDCEFRHYGNLTIEPNILRGTLGLFAPEVLYALRQPFVDPQVTKFFIKLFKDMVDKRKTENINRKDFLNSLIDLMDHEQIINKEFQNSSGGISAGICKCLIGILRQFLNHNVIAKKLAKRLEVLEAAAQAFVFFIAGYETSSSIATHCLYELALNPEIQEKVHKEFDELQNNSETLSYENVFQLEYLDMVFHETMRKHPSVPFLNRISINDYKMPNCDYTVPRGTAIIISVSGLHMDPDIFPEPQKFDPERFNKDNIASRHPYSYLPFGEGPRVCIGKRLGILQSKMALFYLLSNYKFSVCEKTPIPNHYAPKSFVQTPRDGMNLKVEKRK